MYTTKNSINHNSSSFDHKPATSRFAPPKFFVQPQVEQHQPISSEGLEKINTSESNWPDVSMFTYRPAPAPPPRVQMKRNIGKQGDNDKNISKNSENQANLSDGSTVPTQKHWETNRVVQIVGNPQQAQTTIIGNLPPNTRLKIISKEGNNNLGWVQIEVTTGPQMGLQGWVQESSGELELRPETTEVTIEKAKELFSELAGASYVDDLGKRYPIPFHYPANGCYARAHLMAQLLTEKGYASEKVFVISTYEHPLEVKTDFAEDMPERQQYNPVVKWWYHVAPVIKVRTKTNELIEMVIDPSLTKEPVTILQWTGMISTENFQCLSLDQVKQQLEKNQGSYDKNQRILFTASRYAYKSGDLDSPTEATANTKFNRDMYEISRFAGRKKSFEVVAMIRQELRSNRINAERIVTAINNCSPYETRVIKNSFRNLLAELKKRIAPADMAQIEALFKQAEGEDDEENI
ncbi:MAG TPA: protein-glutamine glutaminase family protein [Nostocaceae cyanobacterium]|nr:protein-glutamine glutaminase family protein [Nostocaceae cyanobacterium]